MFTKSHLVVALACVVVLIVASSGKVVQKQKKFVKERLYHKTRAICQASEFQCSNGHCISQDELCDTHRNCPGGADEANCPTNCTGEHQFKCENSNVCIGIIDKCDGTADCSDYSDEAFCGSFACTGGRFKCETSGECIDKDYVCDKEEDCKDGSDEKHCGTDINVSCSAAQFACADGTKCTHLDYVCDGDNDCTDKSDEKDCTCTSSQFKCNTGPCIPNAYKCDGDDDCGDMSDEISCPSLPAGQCADVMTFEDCFHVNETTHPICLSPPDADKFCRKFCGLCKS